MNSPQLDKLQEAVARFVVSRVSEFSEIPAARRTELERLAAYVRERGERSGAAQLIFICTHNSRRSHLSQIWAKVAAEVYGLPQVRTYSGGTEATAMNPRLVAALRRSGLEVTADDPNAENPLYRVRFAERMAPLECFSKVYDQPPNPVSDYCAILTCSSADEACPVVPGCDLRLPIRYDDPKIADDTAEESAVYDERNRQICREMLYAMSQVG